MLMWTLASMGMSMFIETFIFAQSLQKYLYAIRFISSNVLRTIGHFADQPTDNWSYGGWETGANAKNVQSHLISA